MQTRKRTHTPLPMVLARVRVDSDDDTDDDDMPLPPRPPPRPLDALDAAPEHERTVTQNIYFEDRDLSQHRHWAWRSSNLRIYQKQAGLQGWQLWGHPLRKLLREDHDLKGAVAARVLRTAYAMLPDAIHAPYESQATRIRDQVAQAKRERRERQQELNRAMLDRNTDDEDGDAEMEEEPGEGKGVVVGGMAVGMEARAAVSARTIQQP